MKMVNPKGEAVYYNIVKKGGKTQYVIRGIGSTMIVGRDMQRRKSRAFTQEPQAWAYLRRNGFRCV